MVVKDMRTKTEKALLDQSRALRTQLAAAQQKLASGELQNYRSIAKIRRELAQTLTVLREKALSADKEKA